MNATILHAIQTNLTDLEGKSWDREIPRLERDLNTTISKTTGKTPFEMIYGYIPRFEDGLTRALTVDSESYRCPTEIRREAIGRIDREKSKTKKRYDKSRLKNVVYEVGDIVYVKRNKSSTGESTELQPRFKGPLVIVGILSSDTYRVQSLNSKGSAPRTDTTAHVSQIKIWRGFVDDKNDLEDDVESNDSDSEIEDSVISQREQTNREEASEESLSENEDSEFVAKNVDASTEEVVKVNDRKCMRQRCLPKKFTDFLM